jgi:hypothetical protein
MKRETFNLFKQETLTNRITTLWVRKKKRITISTCLILGNGDPRIL